jgi:hypothetical protein
VLQELRVGEKGLTAAASARDLSGRGGTQDLRPAFVLAVALLVVMIVV